MSANEATQEASKSQWQPIETAPRDGTKILAYGKPKFEQKYKPHITLIRYWKRYTYDYEQGILLKRNYYLMIALSSLMKKMCRIF